MTETIAPALDIPEPVFDSRRNDVIQAFKNNFMRPATDKGLSSFSALVISRRTS